MGYHIREIKRGVYGERSKIMEELQEWKDAVEQDNPVMELIELSDLIGAIAGHTEKQFNIGLEGLLKMAAATNRAFEDGTRT